MTTSHDDSRPAQGPAGGDAQSAMFAGLVLQQSNMALMFLGQVPHPETGQPIRQLESARVFIDQLEMLAVKTRGNLTSQEDRMLKDTLTGLRMAFVEAVNHPEPGPKEGAPAKAAEAPKEAAATEDRIASGTGVEPKESGTGAEAESRKKFTKKY